ncbi:MAG TPA: hypothetical protein VKZ73_08420 [Microbacterium sp.]|nr:hypothetical protein [Microbacterium sp.]
MRRDRIVIGPATPGFVLRAGGVLLVAAAALVLQPVTFWQVSFVLAAIAGAVFPRTGLAWAALLVAPLALLMQDISPWRTAIAIVVVHLGHVLAGLNLVIPGRSRVALAALRPTALRWLAVQLASQGVAAAVLTIPRADGSGIAWVAPVGALAVALLAVVLLRRTE